MSADRDRLVETVLDELLKHPRSAEYVQWSCKCGWVWDGIPGDWTGHIAAAVVDALGIEEATPRDTYGITYVVRALEGSSVVPPEDKP